jgi:hypothetical protein
LIGGPAREERRGEKELLPPKSCLLLGKKEALGLRGLEKGVELEKLLTRYPLFVGGGTASRMKGEYCLRFWLEKSIG